jgi:hypothetical protein
MFHGDIIDPHAGFVPCDDGYGRRARTGAGQRFGLVERPEISRAAHCRAS